VYATGDDLIARYDADLVGDLANDDRETIDRTLDNSSIISHPNVIAVLQDASSEIDAALLVGGRYTAAQLASLTGNSKQHLIRMTCAIAMAGLLDRRGESGSKEYRERIYERAKALLKSISSGDNIFGLAENINASVIDVGGPDAIDIQNRNDLTSRMDRYFPTAKTRLPLGR
jgi:phage gp36-like protein